MHPVAYRMPAMVRSLLLATLVAAIGVAPAIAQDPRPSSEAIVGTLQNIEGVVLVKQNGESVPAVEGQQLTKSQEVLVTQGARALVVFNDGCDLALDPEEVYKVSDTSPCAQLWWAGPGAAAVACGAAKVNKNSNSRTLAAIGLAAGAGLLGTSQGREQDFQEYSAAMNEAEGDVSTVDPVTGQSTAVRPGTRLRADQEILVKAGSKALIVFDDGCTRRIEVGDSDKDQTYVIPGNSPCMTPPLWWASAAVASGLCLSVEDEEDVQSP
jgi:hypothetical protein